MKSLKLYLLLLSCVLSFRLSAQETYTWAKDVGKHTMYKHSFFNENIQKVFSIPDSLFTHDNMTGNTNFVNYFEFTKDKTQVYFLETQGDLYLYTLVTKSLEFLGDLTPEISPPSVHAYTQTEGLIFINDSILYINGQTYGTYNINTRLFIKIRQPTDLFNSVTPKEKEISSRSISKFKTDYLYIPDYPHLNELFLNNPDTNKIIFFYDSIWRGAHDITTYQHDCDSTSLYVLANSFYYTIQGVQKYWYKIDMNTGKATFSHPSIKSKFLDTYFIPLQTKHYNTKEWEDCQRVIDLDEDDSTEPDINFRIDGLCYHSGIPLSDLDVKISNEFPLDSIAVEIQNANVEQELMLQTGNYNIMELSPSHIHLVNSGTTTNIEFENAIKNALYIDNGEKKGGSIVINLTAWYDGISGRTAKAKLNIVNPLPNAGQDIDLDYCKSDSTLVLIDVVDILSDKTGGFYNPNFDEISKNIDLNIESDLQIYYVVDNQGCKDTSQIIIKIHPLPTVNSINDTTICFGENVLIDLSELLDNVLWNDGDKSKIKNINVSGEYSYIMTNEFSCKNTDTFNLKVIPQAQSNPVEARICKGEVFNFMNKKYETAGIYHDTISSQSGCDSVIFDIRLDFFNEIPIDYEGDLGFCEGESTKITILSNHNELRINGSNTNKSMEIDDSGIYEISGYDKNGCIEELKLDIKQYSNPEVMTEDLLDISYQSGIELPVKYIGNIKFYKWTPNFGLDCYDCPYPKLLEKQDGIFTIEVTNQYGCIDTANLEVRFKKTIYDIPNVIYNHPYNPLNGVFYLKSNTELRYDMKIYNRWGNLIYEAKDLQSNNSSSGWQPEGKVNSGVFVYMIIIKDLEKQEVIAGDITVL